VFSGRRRRVLTLQLRAGGAGRAEEIAPADLPGLKVSEHALDRLPVYERTAQGVARRAYLVGSI